MPDGFKVAQLSLNRTGRRQPAFAYSVDHLGSKLVVQAKEQPKCVNRHAARGQESEDDNVQQIGQAGQGAPVFSAQPPLVGQIRQKENQDKGYEKSYNQ